MLDAKTSQELVDTLKATIRALNMKTNFMTSDGEMSYTLLARADKIVAEAQKIIDFHNERNGQ